jgi:hypothetical protein
MSVGVGTACTLYEPLVVLEALALTGSVTVSLTVYTFWAARKGVTFQKWGPMLFTCARPPAARPGPQCLLWSLRSCMPSPPERARDAYWEYAVMCAPCSVARLMMHTRVSVVGVHKRSCPARHAVPVGSLPLCTAVSRLLYPHPGAWTATPHVPWPFTAAKRGKDRLAAPQACGRQWCGASSKSSSPCRPSARPSSRCSVRASHPARSRRTRLHCRHMCRHCASLSCCLLRDKIEFRKC